VEQSYFEQAAAVLERAIRSSGLGEQAMLIDEALRLNRLGLAQERAKLLELRGCMEAGASA
jgi:uncharacterized alpha-E superfamily protein